MTDGWKPPTHEWVEPGWIFVSKSREPGEPCRPSSRRHEPCTCRDSSRTSLSHRAVVATTVARPLYVHTQQILCRMGRKTLTRTIDQSINKVETNWTCSSFFTWEESIWNEVRKKLSEQTTNNLYSAEINKRITAHYRPGARTGKAMKECWGEGGMQDGCNGLSVNIIMY